MGLVRVESKSIHFFFFFKPSAYVHKAHFGLLNPLIPRHFNDDRHSDIPAYWRYVINKVAEKGHQVIMQL